MNSLLQRAKRFLGTLATDAGASAAPHDATERLSAIRRRVFDDHGTFSVLSVLAELDEIEPLTSPHSVERGRVMQLRSFVEDKGGRAEDSIRHGHQAFHIDMLHPWLSTPERVALHYSIARQAQSSGDCSTAVTHYHQVLPLMAQDGTSRSGQLGTRERLAFCLHEVGRYTDARALNETTLAEAATLVEPDDPELFPMRMNLAQNQYALGDRTAARRSLELLLADAEAAVDAEMLDRVLFQLGVLAFEDGDSTAALALMDRRLALADASADTARSAASRRDLAVLRAKLADP